MRRCERILSEPDFSPDGKQIVFVAWGSSPDMPRRTGAHNLGIVNVDGTGFQIILTAEDLEGHPISSPDWGA